MKFNTRTYDKNTRQKGTFPESEAAALFAELIEQEARIEALKAELKQAEESQNKRFARLKGMDVNELKFLGLTND